MKQSLKRLGLDIISSMTNYCGIHVSLNTQALNTIIKPHCTRQLLLSNVLLVRLLLLYTPLGMSTQSSGHFCSPPCSVMDKCTLAVT